jgi:hypothetical protein
VRAGFIGFVLVGKNFGMKFRGLIASGGDLSASEMGGESGKGFCDVVGVGVVELY